MSEFTFKDCVCTVEDSQNFVERNEIFFSEFAFIRVLETLVRHGMSSRFPKILVELPLWLLANIVCSALPIAAVYTYGTDVLGWSQVQTGFYMSAMLLVTMTWGSWAALIWSRSRAVRVGLRASTVLPGVATSLIGMAGLWSGFGPIYAWAIIIASGIGTSIAAVTLSKTFGVRPHSFSATQLVAGILGFPLLTTFVSSLIGGVWYHFVTNPADGNWRSLVSFSAIMVTVMAVALMSTIIPAVTSSLVQRTFIARR